MSAVDGCVELAWVMDLVRYLAGVDRRRGKT
jgi:3-oxoacyl-ACP reductase-like protein